MDGHIGPQVLGFAVYMVGLSGFLVFSYFEASYWKEHPYLPIGLGFVWPLALLVAVAFGAAWGVTQLVRLGVRFLVTRRNQPKQTHPLTRK